MGVWGGTGAAAELGVVAALETTARTVGVDEVEVQGLVLQALLCRHQSLFEVVERQRRIAPALLEDAVDLVEQEEQAVLLVEGEFHLTRAEGLARDDVRARELQDEHRAVGVDLEHGAVGLRGNRQREFLADFKIRVLTHIYTPLLLACLGSILSHSAAGENPTAWLCYT